MNPFRRGPRLGLLVLVAIAALLPTGSAAAAGEGFGIAGVDGEVLAEDGSAESRAGAHPFSASTEIQLNTFEGNFGRQPYGNLREVEVDLPVGFAGDPTAMPKCTAAQFYEDMSAVVFVPKCPPSSQVGYATFAAVFQGKHRVPLYNMVPQPGLPAQFAFRALTSNVFLDAHVRSADNGITIKVSNTSQGYALYSTGVTIWGNPANPVHDAIRGSHCIDYGLGTGFSYCEVGYEGGVHSDAPERAFITNPTSCVGPVQTQVRVRSWAGATDSSSFTSHDTEGNPIGVSHCDDVPFEPTFKASIGEASAGSPSGLRVEVGVPQSENPNGLASSHLKDVTVQLPAGVSVNASSADGLAACSEAQIGLKTDSVPSCPDASKIGSVRVDTPLLEQPLEGSLYLAQQRQNPFGSLLATYLVAEGSGVVVKVPGRVDADPSTGQLTASFDDNPQLPFSRLTVQLFGGSRAPLKMPEACGTYTATASFSPWARPGQAVGRSSSFQITSGPGGGPCPNGGFDPKLTAGTTNPIAGDHSPFTLQVSREDGSQQLGSITASLPKGLLASLRGVPYCPDAALAGISGNEGTGAAQNASPSCPAASQVGSVTVGAGAGPSPFYLQTGKAYLAGPYKGAPMSLAIVTPALAGPFDLGTVVVRSALRVDPTTAEITAVSDPLPTILHGIPLDLRDVRVNIDRQGFTLNPTSCDPMQVESSIVSTQGKTASPSSRFQVTNCAALAFKPFLKLKVSGPTKRGKYPKLRAELKAPAGQANIGKVSVALPHSEFLAQEHIKTICTRVQYSANGGGGKACPKGSVYGWARAFTPLLDQPLEGPVYLRSSSNPLPDLVASLDGQIHIDLVGRIDSVNGGIRNTFEAVPDAPVSKFVLTMKGGKKSLLVNSRNLCATTNRATVKIDGQNGKVHDFRPLVGNSCGRSKKG